MRLVCTRKPDHLINYISQSYPDIFRSAVTQVCMSVVNEENHSICKQGVKSSFQSKKVKDFKDLYITQHLELQKYAPFLLMLISKIAMNPKAGKRNKLKTTESLIPEYDKCSWYIASLQKPFHER